MNVTVKPIIITIMTEKEILEVERGYSESKIQHICVSWFRQTFPEVGNLFVCRS